MASSQAYYLITINNGNANSAPADGFVDNKRVENYVPVDLSEQPAGWSYVTCLAKRRGNVRFRDIINQIELVSNCTIPIDTIASDATANTEGTEFSFYILVDHGDEWLVTRNESIAGTTLSGAAAIQRCVARALCLTSVRTLDVYDPTESASVGDLGANSISRVGTRVVAGVTIGAYAANLAAATALVTVSKVTF